MVRIMIAVVLVLTGCAGFKIERISDVNDGEEGYVFYGPEPYLMRSTNVDKDGNVTGYSFNVLYLPNPTRRYRVDTWNVLGQAKFDFTFADGWRLTAINAETDNTAIATQFLETLGQIAPDLMGIMQPAPAADAPPQLYRLLYSEHGVLTGLQQVELTTTGKSFNEIEATVPSEPDVPQ